MPKQIMVFDSDARQKQLAALLREHGYTALAASALPQPPDAAVKNSALLLLPYPPRDEAQAGGLSCGAVFRLLQHGQIVCGGGFSNAQRQQAEACGAVLLDYTDSEAFLQINAHLTAQGALRLLLEDCGGLLSEEQILIVGYGRIGAALASHLTALHCSVIVAARREEQRVRASLSGCETIDFAHLPQKLHRFDRIINTVPHRIFSAKAAACCKRGVRYLELASAPGGADPADFGAAWQSGAGLPGRFTPRKSAAALFSLIEPRLKEGEFPCNPPSAMP